MPSQFRCLARCPGYAAVAALLAGLVLAAGATIPNQIARGADLLATDFRKSPADEGWKEVGAGGDKPFQGGLIAVADDPAEYGVQIRQGSVFGPKITVEPFHYYRLRFRSKVAKRAHWAATFLAKDGQEIVSDVYDSIDGSSDWRSHTFMFRAHADATHVRIRFQPSYNEGEGDPLAVRNLRLDEVPATAVAEWADAVVSPCPLFLAEPAADRWQLLPRTIERLRSGKKLRIVMLGDSICNDTSNSLYETRLARFYPQASVEVVTSVRGGTGCWYYKDENRIKQYVLDYQPDLLMIAGISHHFDPESIRSVIRQVRQSSDCEILVMSGAVTPNDFLQRMHLLGKPVSQAMDEMENFPGRLRRMCREEKAEFFDLRNVWDDYMHRSALPYDFISRDSIHANSRGKQLLARMLNRYFEPKDDE